MIEHSAKATNVSFFFPFRNEEWMSFSRRMIPTSPVNLASRLAHWSAITGIRKAGIIPLEDDPEILLSWLRLAQQAVDARKVRHETYPEVGEQCALYLPIYIYTYMCPKHDANVGRHISRIFPVDFTWQQLISSQLPGYYLGLNTCPSCAP